MTKYVGLGLSHMSFENGTWLLVNKNRWVKLILLLWVKYISGFQMVSDVSKMLLQGYKEEKPIKCKDRLQ